MALAASASAPRAACAYSEVVWAVSEAFEETASVIAEIVLAAEDRCSSLLDSASLSAEDCDDS